MSNLILPFPRLVVSEAAFMHDGRPHSAYIRNAVVCGMKKSRAYYAGAYTKGGQPPNCSADDGRVGREINEKQEVVNTLQCAGCPKKDTDCKLYHILLIVGETERQNPDYFQLQVAKKSGGELLYQLFVAATKGIKPPFKFDSLTVETKIIKFSPPLAFEGEPPLKVIGSPGRDLWEIETGLAIGFDSDQTPDEPQF